MTGLVLDLDDTLYPERAFHESGFAWIAARTGLDPSGSEVSEARRELRRPRGRPLDCLSRTTGIPVGTLVTWHREHVPTIDLYADAVSFIARARARGLPLVLLTDGRSVTQRHKIESLGLEGVFQAIYISEETGFDKLDIRSFWRAAAGFRGIGKIAYFGDNPKKDLNGPHQLGWSTFLMLDRGDNVHPQSPQDVSGYAFTPLRSFNDITFSASG